jgi:hypothetical protein
MARNVGIKSRIDDLDTLRCRLATLPIRAEEHLDQTDTQKVALAEAEANAVKATADGPSPAARTDYSTVTLLARLRG